MGVPSPSRSPVNHALARAGLLAASRDGRVRVWDFNELLVVALSAHVYAPVSVLEFREASEHFGACLTRFLPAVARSDARKPFLEQTDLPVEIMGAVMVAHGKLTPSTVPPPPPCVCVFVCMTACVNRLRLRGGPAGVKRACGSATKAEARGQRGVHGHHPLRSPVRQAGRE